MARFLPRARSLLLMAFALGTILGLRVTRADRREPVSGPGHEHAAGPVAPVRAGGGAHLGGRPFVPSPVALPEAAPAVEATSPRKEQRTRTAVRARGPENGGSGRLPNGRPPAQRLLVHLDRLPTLAERRALAMAGVHLAVPLGGGRFVADVVGGTRLPPAGPFPRILQVGPLDPAEKVDAGLLARATRGGPDRLRVQVAFEEEVDLVAARAAIEAVGGHPEGEGFLYGRRLEAAIPARALLELATRPEVRRIGDVDPGLASGNLDAAILVGADRLHAPPAGLTGQGVVVGIWDGGAVDAGHRDFEGRIDVVDGDPGAPADHATHVAGTFVGAGVGDPRARGLAPGASLLSYDFFGDLVGEQARARARGLVVANHSWEYLIGWHGDAFLDNQYLFGAYTLGSETWDALVEAEDLVVVKAAGNGRRHGEGVATPAMPHDGTLVDGRWFDLLDPVSAAKNVITVGASDDAGVASASFSAAGPTDDGRVKPDLLAPGIGLLSTVPGQRYRALGGTSMASPVVAGAAALLVEARREATGQTPGAAWVRAVLVQTAQDLLMEGPDAESGFGLLDVGAAAALARDVRRTVASRLGHGEGISYLLRIDEGTPAVRVTLAWTDPPGWSGGEAVLVDDLDLSLVGPDGAIHHPAHLVPGEPTTPARRDGPNRVDPVERIDVRGPAAGIWRLRVVGTAVSSVARPFVLASSVPIATVSAEAIALPLEGPAPLQVDLRARTQGDPREIRWDFGDGTPEAEGGEVSHTFVEPGTYRVTLSVRGSDPSEVDRASVTVHVTEGITPSFQADPIVGAVPLEVRFRDLTDLPGGEARWDFGDGTTGVGEAPVHVYEAPGRYTVVLEVEGPTGRGALTRRELVHAVAPLSSLTALPRAGRAPLRVQFGDASGEPAVWDFGDGTIRTAVQPVHVYQKPGNYEAKRVLRIAESGETRTDSLTINVLADGEGAGAPVPSTGGGGRRGGGCQAAPSGGGGAEAAGWICTLLAAVAIIVGRRRGCRRPAPRPVRHRRLRV